MIDTQLASDDAKLLLATLKTVLPANIQLTSDEIYELWKFERITGEAFSHKLTGNNDILEDKLRFDFNISSTTNAGIHYFCIQQNIVLKFLVVNTEISLTVAELIFNKLESLPPSMVMVTAYFQLASNPVVYSDTALFMKVFQRLTDRSKASFVRPFVSVTPSMNIDITMFLMSFIGENDIELQRVFGVIADSRKDEVLAWVENDNPELIKMPLSWILRSYGFYVIMENI